MAMFGGEPVRVEPALKVNSYSKKIRRGESEELRPPGSATLSSNLMACTSIGVDGLLLLLVLRRTTSNAWNNKNRNPLKKGEGDEQTEKNRKEEVALDDMF